MHTPLHTLPGTNVALMARGIAGPPHPQISHDPAWLAPGVVARTLPVVWSVTPRTACPRGHLPMSCGAASSWSRPSGRAYWVEGLSVFVIPKYYHRY